MKRNGDFRFIRVVSHRPTQSAEGGQPQNPSTPQAPAALLLVLSIHCDRCHNLSCRDNPHGHLVRRVQDGAFRRVISRN